MSNEKLLEDGETPRYQRLLSDAAATTFTGMFRKGKRKESPKDRSRDPVFPESDGRGLILMCGKRYYMNKSNKIK